MSPKYKCGGNHWLNKNEESNTFLNNFKFLIDPQVLADMQAWADAIDPKDVAEMFKDMVDLER